jgi:hypothetical protein
LSENDSREKTVPGTVSLKVDTQLIRQGSIDFFRTRLIRGGRLDLAAELRAGRVDMFGGFAGSRRLFRFNFKTNANFRIDRGAAIRVP